MSHHIISIVSIFIPHTSLHSDINTHSICIYKRSAPSWTLYPEPNAINEAAPRGSDLFNGKTTRLYALHRGGRRVWYAPHPPSSFHLILFTSLHNLSSSPLRPSLDHCPPVHSPSLSIPILCPSLPPLPPPTKTKRYAPLHLIDPTSFTEGKTMREAAGGRSAWIS
jgi:hypothetical protein